MRLLSLLLFITLTTAAPPETDDDYHLPLFYTAEHNVVNIVLPLNSLNGYHAHNNFIYEPYKTLFFVQADIKDGVKDYKGLYVLKHGVATKLLENGRDATATSFDNTKLVYFGAADGLYSYDVENNKAVKYGTVTDSIIGLAKVSDSDVIYILTEDKALFKVTENGTKIEKVDDVKNAEQIVLDSSNNVYYYSSDKKLYVKGVEGVKKIEGLPEDATEILLLRPPFLLTDEVLVIVDNKSYMIHSNGTSELYPVVYKGMPSAFSFEASSPQFFAYGKDIHEYSIESEILISLIEELKSMH